MAHTHPNRAPGKTSFQLLRPCPPQPHRPPFIFLPGMDGTGQLQQAQAQRLGTIYDVRCLAIPTDDESSWETLTAKILRLIAAEFPTPRHGIVLLGESFGGCLALKLAQRSPHLFRQLILVNPASALEHTPLIRWGSSLSQWIPEALYPLSCMGLLPFLSALDRISPDQRQALLTAMQSVRQRSALWRLNLLQQLQISDADLRRIAIPTLIVASGGDRLLPSVTEAQRLQRLLPQAQVHILPDSGHACLLEEDIHLLHLLQHQGIAPIMETPALV